MGADVIANDVVEGYVRVVDAAELIGIPRPSLLGSIVGQACAVDVDDVPTSQEIDLAPLSLVEDPFVLRGQLTAKDRQRLRPRHSMIERNHCAWRHFDTAEGDRARTALRILLAI